MHNVHTFPKDIQTKPSFLRICIIKAQICGTLLYMLWFLWMMRLDNTRQIDNPMHRYKCRHGSKHEGGLVCGNDH